MLAYDAPTRWLARSELFRDLATASLDRVVGRNTDDWIPRGPEAQLLRRLQNEMQMLLYTHAVNDARSARGLSTVNAFWVSGTGTPTTSPLITTERLETVDLLRHAALRDDAQAWVQAWQALDTTVLADLLQRVRAGKADQITLCGERMAVTLELQERPWWERIQQRFSTSSPQQLLQTL